MNMYCKYVHTYYTYNIYCMYIHLYIHCTHSIYSVCIYIIYSNISSLQDIGTY